ncbi:MAG: MarR family transcriptional regulator [Burkholderiales bacterium]|nr:MarR family transcriptional regulator [Burkholderiales bacterium]
MNDDLTLLHDALLDLTGLFNQPQPDAVLIREAGIELDRALMPLLVRIERRGPIGVVALADMAGRDYTTVSRQVAKLESLGLIARRAGAKDRRVREAVISERGMVLVAALNRAREGIYLRLFAGWSSQDRQQLATLTSRFAQSAMEMARRLGEGEAGDEPS